MQLGDTSEVDATDCTRARSTRPLGGFNDAHMQTLGCAVVGCHLHRLTQLPGRRVRSWWRHAVDVEYVAVEELN
jgi:hypothetical protein